MDQTNGLIDAKVAPRETEYSRCRLCPCGLLWVRSLSHCVALLLACGIFRKAIVPSNFAVFKLRHCDGNDSTEYNLACPYSTGFDWARHTSDELQPPRIPIPSEGEKHPADGQMGSPTNDTSGFLTCSLRLVLLQIGTWHALSDIGHELFTSGMSQLDKLDVELTCLSERRASLSGYTTGLLSGKMVFSYDWTAKTPTHPATRELIKENSNASRTSQTLQNHFWALYLQTSNASCWQILASCVLSWRRVA